MNFPFISLLNFQTKINLFAPSFLSPSNSFLLILIRSGITSKHISVIPNTLVTKKAYLNITREHTYYFSVDNRTSRRRERNTLWTREKSGICLFHDHDVPHASVLIAFLFDPSVLCHHYPFIPFHSISMATQGKVITCKGMHSSREFSFILYCYTWIAE